MKSWRPRFRIISLLKRSNQKDRGLKFSRIVGLELRPLTSVLFRPEEVHVRSPVSAAWPLHADGSDGISHERLRLDRQYLFIAHNYNHGLAAVQTRRIHPYRLSRE